MIYRTKGIRKKSLFWILQSAGWGFYFLNDLYLFTGYSNYTLKSLVLFSVTFLIGFCLTSLLRYPYRALYTRLRTIGLFPVFIIIASIVTAALWYLSDVLISMPFWDQQTYNDWLNNLSFRTLIRRNYLHFPIILLWSSFYFGIKFLMEREEQKEKAERSALLAKESQLRLLRYQLNPHFLFNSLVSIRALVLENPAKARDMITDLSEFLRHSLIPEGELTTTLNQELGIIMLYFDIEKNRFEDKLQVSFNISEDTKNIQVPALILQPFIENAIKYGMMTSTMPLKIEIKTRRTKSELQITITNTGKWIERGSTFESENWSGTGRGIENARMRLETAYPDGFSLTIQKNLDDVTVLIHINLP